MRERVGAVIVKDRAVLLVTGYEGTAYWTPGGTKLEGESDEAALRRELREELGIEIRTLVPYCDFAGTGHRTGEDVHYLYYRVEYDGECLPQDEVTGYAWYNRANLDRNEPRTLPSFRDHLAPRLVADDLI